MWQYSLSTAVGLIGAYLLWRATQVEGSASEKAFGFGLMLLLLAFCTAWHWRSSTTAVREGELESQMHSLRQDQIELTRALQEIQLNLGAREAAKRLAGVVRRAEKHEFDRGYVRLVEDQKGS